MFNYQPNYKYKEILIKPKRKYVYITFDKTRTFIVEKNRFSLDMGFDCGCKCKHPTYQSNSPLCGKCNRIIG